MDTSKILLLRNNYAPDTGASFSVKWGSTTYTSLASWLTAASTQETINGERVGLSVDPMLTSPGSGGTLGDTTLLASLSAYKLKVGSPMVDAGLNLTQAPYSLSLGLRDYYGNNLPLGAAYDMGAHERNAYADRDGDGIPDDFEEAFGTNAGSNDVLGDSGDGDGLSNLLEYAFGLSPLEADATAAEFDFVGGVLVKRGVPVTMFRPADVRAVFLRRKDYTSARLRYVPQFSADLSTWQDSVATPTVVAVSDEMELVSVPYPALVAGKVPHFFRVTVAANAVP